jgi:hypothetical protein
VLLTRIRLTNLGSIKAISSYISHALWCWGDVNRINPVTNGFYRGITVWAGWAVLIGRERSYLG